MDLNETPDAVTEPAAGSATTPDTPNSGALSEAFATLAQQMTGAMRAPEPVAATPDPELPKPTSLKPERDEAGRFVAQQPPAADPEPEAPVAEPEAPAPAEAATDVGADDEAGEPALPDPELIVEVLPRWANGEPVEIVLQDKETADLLRHSLKGAMRREEFDQAMQDVRAREQQLEEQATMLVVDPVRTVQETLTEDQTELLVLALLTDDRVYQRVQERLPELLDDQSRRLVRADVREKYLDAREQASGQVETQRAVTRNLQETKAALSAIIPEHLNEAQRGIFLRDAMRELSVVCRQHNIRLLDPMQIPAALSSRLTAYGVDPRQAAETIASTLYGRGRAPAAATARPEAAPALASAPRAAATPKPGTRTVQALRASQSRREAAAATAGAGVGTPAAGGLPSLPKGAGLDEAFALFRRGT
jgi:hypothetical protein